MLSSDVRYDLKVLGYKTESAMMAEEVLKPAVFGVILPLIILIVFHSLAAATIIPFLAASIQSTVQKNDRKAKKTAMFGLIIPSFCIVVFGLGATLAAF